MVGMASPDAAATRSARESPADVDDDVAGRRERRSRRSTARKTIGRTVRVLLFLFVIIQFGLPQIGGMRRAIHELNSVDPLLLAAGLGLQIASLVAYTCLTRAALPRDNWPKRSLLFRIQLSTKAVTNVVPGGSAAGSALGYRLLTISGVRGADAGFALATSGLGSAIVLNLLLWTALLISIPFAGFSPIYVTAALAGIFVLGAFAMLVVLLMKGEQQAERWLRAIARKVRFLNEDRVGALVGRLARRLRELMGDRELLARIAGWAVANWLLDAASLWVFLRAFGATVGPVSLIVSFCVANVLAAIPITPGGLGVLDVTLASMLLGFGVPSAAVGLGVPAYRIVQYWLPIPLGGISYFSLRFGPWKIDREHGLRTLRDETAEYVRSGEMVYDWAERFGYRGVVGPPKPPELIDAEPEPFEGG
jgi:putative heme transporter